MQPISDVLPDVLNLWKNVLPSMLLGCFLGNLFQNTVLLQRLGRVMHPLARLGRLPVGCATSLTLCLVDRIAAYTMLAGLKNTGVVGAREVVVSFLVSALPTGLYFTVFFLQPGGYCFPGVPHRRHVPGHLPQYELDGRHCRVVARQVNFAAAWAGPGRKYANQGSS